MDHKIELLKISEDDYGLILSLLGDDKDVLSNGYLMSAIVNISRLYKLGEAGNPYYKFIELLRDAWKNNYITFWSLETIEEYYNVGVIDCLIKNSESFLGSKVSCRSDVKRIVDTKKRTLDFDGFVALVNTAMIQNSLLKSFV